MSICHTQIQSLQSTSWMMNCLTQLMRELEDYIRLVVIKITQKEELGSLMLHFQKMEINGNVIIEDGFSFRVGFTVYSTKDENFDFRFGFWEDLDPDYFDIFGNNDVINLTGGKVPLIDQYG